MSVIARAALREPLTVGVNVTLIVQDAFTANVFGLGGQVFVCAKSLVLVPVSTILLTSNAAVPLLVRVIVCALLVVPLFWLPKFRRGGLILNAAVDCVAVPLNVTV